MSILKGGFHVGCSGRMNAPAQDIRDVGNVWVEFSRQRDVLSLRKGNAQTARCTGGEGGWGFERQLADCALYMTKVSVMAQ